MGLELNYHRCRNIVNNENINMNVVQTVFPNYFLIAADPGCRYESAIPKVSAEWHNACLG